jgi:hypothetical protein
VLPAANQAGTDGTEPGTSAWAGGDEPESVTADADVHLRVGEARCAQTTWQLVGIHGQEHVADVHLAATWGIHAVGADQDASWPQHAAELAEHVVLQRDGGHVVQHREAGNRGEPAAVEGERDGVGLHDLDAGVRKASPQRGCQMLIHLDRYQSWDSPPEGIGDQTRTGTHLQHLLAELATVDHPGQQHVLDELGPLGAGAQFQVLRVHLTSSVAYP